MAELHNRTDQRLPGLATAGAIFIGDQLMKWIVASPLQLEARGLIHVTSFFNFRWVPNPGVSMGFLLANSETQRWLLVGLTAAISAAVLFWLWREKRRDDAIALGFVLGGALGNIFDRVRFGFVVDYADLHFGEWRPFLIFNVGDAAITIGVLLLLVRALLMREPKASKKEV
jgi:signal peptidase II